MMTAGNGICQTGVSVVAKDTTTGDKFHLLYASDINLVQKNRDITITINHHILKTLFVTKT